MNVAVAPVFEAELISKTFPGVQALESVSLAGYPGEVLAICGANGAGKSTLAKLLAGLMAPTSGAIRLLGAPMKHTMPRDGIDAGVLMMYQEPLIIEHLSVEENLWLFDLNRSWVSLKVAHDRAETRELLTRVRT